MAAAVAAVTAVMYMKYVKGCAESESTAATDEPYRTHTHTFTK